MSKLTRVVNFYKSFIESNDLCFDVGANIGDRTAALLQIGARVVAFEPQPACVEKLKKRFSDKAIIVQTAIGSKDGSAMLKLTRTSTIASMNQQWINRVKEHRFKKFNWNKSIEVAVTSLDKMILIYGKPKFLKIDVEGFEFEVFKGLHHNIQHISFEFTPEIIDIAVSCVDYLHFLSPAYAFNYSEGESMVLALKKWVSFEKIIKILKQTKGSPIFGDVYARLNS